MRKLLVSHFLLVLQKKISLFVLGQCSKCLGFQFLFFLLEPFKGFPRTSLRLHACWSQRSVPAGSVHNGVSRSSIEENGRLMGLPCATAYDHRGERFNVLRIFIRLHGPRHVASSRTRIRDSRDPPCAPGLVESTTTNLCRKYPAQPSMQRKGGCARYEPSPF